MPIDVTKALLALRYGEVVGGDHVAEDVFLNAKGFELFVQVSSEKAGDAGAVSQCLMRHPLERLDEVGVETDRLVVLLHSGVRKGNNALRRVANVILDAAATILAVFTSRSAGRTLAYRAPDLVAFVKTLAAGQVSPEVLVIPAPSLSGIACVSSES